MEPEGSLPHSQVPLTCPYPEPDRSSPYTHFLKMHLNIILTSIPGPSKWSLSLRFPSPKPCIHLSPKRATCLAHLILLDLITRTIFGEQYRSLSYSCSLFSLFCYLVPPRPKCSPQHPILKHTQPTYLPQCEWPRFNPYENTGKL